MMTSIFRLRVLAFAMLWLCTASAGAAEPARDSHDDYEEGFEVGVQCNEAARRLDIGDVHLLEPSSAAPVTRPSIPPPGVDDRAHDPRYGDPYRAPGPVSTLTCGPFSIALHTGYLNPDTEGELGLMTFPVVTVTRPGHVVLVEAALTRCEGPIDLYRVVGPCPTGFARRISLSWSVTRPEVELSVLREWVDKGGQERARTESRVIAGTGH